MHTNAGYVDDDMPPGPATLPSRSGGLGPSKGGRAQGPGFGSGSVAQHKAQQRRALLQQLQEGVGPGAGAGSSAAGPSPQATSVAAPAARKLTQAAQTVLPAGGRKDSSGPRNAIPAPPPPPPPQSAAIVGHKLPLPPPSQQQQQQQQQQQKQPRQSEQPTRGIRSSGSNLHDPTVAPRSSSSLHHHHQQQQQQQLVRGGLGRPGISNLALPASPLKTREAQTSVKLAQRAAPQLPSQPQQLQPQQPKGPTPPQASSVQPRPAGSTFRQELTSSTIPRPQPPQQPPFPLQQQQQQQQQQQRQQNLQQQNLQRQNLQQQQQQQGSSVPQLTRMHQLPAFGSMPLGGVGDFCSGGGGSKAMSMAMSGGLVGSSMGMSVGDGMLGSNNPVFSTAMGNAGPQANSLLGAGLEKLVSMLAARINPIDQQQQQQQLMQMQLDQQERQRQLELLLTASHSDGNQVVRARQQQQQQLEEQQVCVCVCVRVCAC